MTGGGTFGQSGFRARFHGSPMAPAGLAGTLRADQHPAPFTVTRIGRRTVRSIHSAAATLAAAALAAPASAQSYTPDSVAVYSLFWSELDADYQPVPTPDGLLERGERALLRLNVSFTNQNTVGSFTPPAGTFTSGTIRGLGQGVIDLVGTGGAQGEWNLDPVLNLGVNLEWDLTGGAGAGTPGAGGALLRTLQFGQFPQFAFQINTTNPIETIWSGVWTPESYQPRTVEFLSAPSPLVGEAHSFVLVRTSSIFYIAARCGANFGAVQIPIVPAPAGTLALVGGAVALGRGRRCKRSEG